MIYNYLITGRGPFADCVCGRKQASARGKRAASNAAVNHRLHRFHRCFSRFSVSRFWLDFPNRRLIRNLNCTFGPRHQHQQTIQHLPPTKQRHVTETKSLTAFFSIFFSDYLIPFRKSKRVRTAFSPSQLLKLEHAFESNHYVVGAERKQLAQNLNLSETQVITEGIVFGVEFHPSSRAPCFNPTHSMYEW